MITAFVNGIIYTGTECIRDKILLIEGDLIIGLVDKQLVPADATIVDCTGTGIAPGLIDLQVYGGGGFLFSAIPTATALHAMAEALVSSGTTGFLLTLATNSIDVFHEAIRIVQQNPHPALLGLHFEGPYLNPVKKGAHAEPFIRTASVPELKSLLETAAGSLKMMTLAPECVSPEVIALLHEYKVVISAGHSNATFEEANSGFRQGIQSVTHLFNAMSPMHHRDTGLPGAAFQSGHVYASIIADGIHVDYQAVSISKKVMGERLFLITDAVDATQEPPYIHVKQSDRFTLPDGTLSGSNVTLFQSVQNCVKHVGIAMDEALRMASLYPARLMGYEHVGSLQSGMLANFITFDETGILTVWLNGQMKNY